MAFRFFLSLLVLSLLSCADITSSRTSPVTVEAERAVAGSSIVITSADFRRQSVPVIAADSVILLGTELKRLPLPACSEDLLVDAENGVLYLATIAGGTPHGYRS